MGNAIEYLKSLIYKKDAKVLMLGLDAAGKTTILYQLKLGLPVETIPTMGFVYESIQHKNFKLNVWDVAGQDSLRSLWKHYYQNTKAIIFVVDSSDRKRIGLAKDELHKIMSDEELKDACLLVLSNKMDLQIMTVEEVSGLIEFEKIKSAKKKILGVCGLKGEGLTQALNWLVSSI